MLCRPKMYKSRFTRWNIGKNYKAAEKESIADHITLCARDGRTAPALRLRGKPVKMHRIQRFCRQQQDRKQESTKSSEHGAKLGRLAGTADSHSMSDPNNEDRQVRSQHSLDALSLVVPASERTAHFLLHEVKTYLEKVLALELLDRAVKLERCEIRLNISEVDSGRDLTSTPPRLSNSGSWFETWLGMTRGLFELTRLNFTAACEWFDSACNLTRHFVTATYWLVLDVLIKLFIVETWTNFGSLRTHLLEFFLRMSKTLLPRGHPLTNIFSMLSQDNDHRIAPQPYLCLIQDTIARRLGLDSWEAQYTKRSRVKALRLQKKLVEAEALASSFLKESTYLYGPHHPYTLMFLQALARVYDDQNRLVEAQSLYEEIRQQIKRNNPMVQDPEVSEQYNWLQSDALEELCVLSIRIGAVNRSKEYLQHIFNGEHERFWNHRDLCLRTKVEMLEDRLVSVGKPQQAAYLQPLYKEGYIL